MMSASEKKKVAPNPANPALLKRGAAALGLLPFELTLVLQFRPIRLRAEPLPAYEFGEGGDTISFGPPDSSPPPRSSRIDARPGWQEVLAAWVNVYTPAHLEMLVERLPMHAAAVVDAMTPLPKELPANGTEDDLKNLAALIMPVRRMHITFAVLCAATDMLGAVLASAMGAAYEEHHAYDILLHSPAYKAYGRLRRLLWRALHPKEYAEQRARSAARWNASRKGKDCKRDFMRRRREDATYAEAERARRRERYAEKNRAKASGGST
jgi:hypothetical protein